MTYAENVVAVYERAIPAERAEGMRWYDGANALALSLSPGDAWRGAGVIAALSPQRKWDTNVRHAVMAFETGVVFGQTPTMNAQAQRILDGEFALDVLNGQKVRAFCSAIADPYNCEMATIDRHAHDIAAGRVYTEAERNITKSLFNKMDMHYRQAALELGIGTIQLQAATWVRWRNEKGIK